MSALIAFYRGTTPDTEGRFLSELWAWDDDALEAVHDFIQWLFPLPEPSRFNPDAPLLTKADIDAFQADPGLQNQLRKSFQRVLTFLGLCLKNDRVAEAANFGSRVPDIWSAPNHNWLRISRILRSLTLLGCRPEAQAFFVWLESTYRGKKYPIDATTFGYWQRAVQA